MVPLEDSAWQTVERIAHERMRKNDKTRRAECDLGTIQKNFSVDCSGAAGEVGFNIFLRAALPELDKPNAEWFIRQVPAVLSRPIKEPDVQIIRRGYSKFVADVKSSTSLYCTINEKQRRERPAPFYIPVRVISGRGIEVFEPIPSVVVASWELRQGHSPYRSEAFSRIKSLTPIEFRAWLEKNLTPVDRIPRISVN